TSAYAQGARFIVRLPSPARAIPVLADAGLENAQRGAAPRVLVVDDEAAVRRALSRFFHRRGWDVVEAENGLQARQHLVDADEHFDLVISDVEMPKLSGIELYESLRTARPAILDRTIFCTGQAQSARVAAFVAKSGCRVLLKPFDLQTLTAISDEIASRRTGSSFAA